LSCRPPDEIASRFFPNGSLPKPLTISWKLTRIAADGRRKTQNKSGETREGVLGKHKWPPWWEWDLELSPHLLKRMVDRRFTELDLRRMLDRATGIRRDIVKGRWVIRTRHRGRPWEVIVEPDPTENLLVVITAYPLEQEEG
jgi:hypothetical protein